MSPEQFNQAVVEAVEALRLAANDDWSKHALALEWTCRTTVDHMIDCVYSYAMQLAARADGGFLPFEELHATTEASNQELLDGLAAVARILHDLVVCAPGETVASDGVVSLGLADWCARGAFEIALHTYDVMAGLGHDWQLSDALSDAISSSPMLWMFDTTKVADGSAGFNKLLAGSGRAASAYSLGPRGRSTRMRVTSNAGTGCPSWNEADDQPDREHRRDHAATVPGGRSRHRLRGGSV